MLYVDDSVSQIHTQIRPWGRTLGLLLCGNSTVSTVNTQKMTLGGPLMFLLLRSSMWPQSTSFIVTEGNTEALIIPPPPPFSTQNDSQNPSAKVQASMTVCISTCVHNRNTLPSRTHAQRYFLWKVWDAPGSLQSKPMAQHLARRYFFYRSVFFTSKAFSRMTSSVKAVPTRLTINSFIQRKSFSLIHPFIHLYFVM